MRRFVLVGILLAFVTLGMVNDVFAVASGPPAHDTFVRETASGTNFNTQDLSVVGSTTACNPTDTVYFKWDLADIAGGEVVQTALLTLTANFVSATSSATLALYQASDNYQAPPASWTESELKASNAPAPGTLIETQPAPTAIGQTVVFDSAALASYVNNEAGGDNVASFALRFSGGCEVLTVARFEDRESSTGGPDLQLSNLSAVGLRSFDGAGLVTGKFILFMAFIVVTVLLWARQREVVKK